MVARTDATTTNIMPMPIATNTLEGTSSIPANATTTVNPLKTTARVAVALALPMASTFSRPLRRSSRYLVRMKSE